MIVIPFVPLLIEAVFMCTTRQLPNGCATGADHVRNPCNLR